jgi:hypothetical protein
MLLRLILIEVKKFFYSAGKGRCAVPLRPSCGAKSHAKHKFSAGRAGAATSDQEQKLSAETTVGAVGGFLVDNS